MAIFRYFDVIFIGYLAAWAFGMSFWPIIKQLIRISRYQPRLFFIDKKINYKTKQGSFFKIVRNDKRRTLPVSPPQTHCPSCSVVSAMNSKQSLHHTISSVCREIWKLVVVGVAVMISRADMIILEIDISLDWLIIDWSLIDH